MATTLRIKPHTRASRKTLGVRYMSTEEGRAALDAQAREYLGMSGEEFIRRYKAGDIEDPGRFDVVRLSFLIPFAE